MDSLVDGFFSRQNTTPRGRSSPLPLRLLFNLLSQCDLSTVPTNLFFAKNILYENLPISIKNKYIPMQGENMF